MQSTIIINLCEESSSEDIRKVIIGVLYITSSFAWLISLASLIAFMQFFIQSIMLQQYQNSECELFQFY